MSSRLPPTPEQLLYEMTVLLTHLADAPEDLQAHQRLLETGVRYKAAGGRSLSMLEKVKRPADDPVARLVHTARHATFDPGNIELLVAYDSAAAACERAGLAVGPVQRWLHGLVSDAGDPGA
jgi:hypothetical protein